MSSKLSLACGAAVIILGGITVFAWLTNNVWLVQIRPNHIAMSIPVALEFVLAGLGLIFINFVSRRTTQIIGIFIISVAGLATFDFFFSDTPPENSPFRPMRPMTAMSFSIAGLAFLATGKNEGLSKDMIIPGVSGAIIFAIGALAFSAHLLELSATEGWGKTLRMAVHVPGGFGILALGLISYAWYNETQKVIGSPQWLPILVGIGLIAFTFGLWIHLDIQPSSLVSTAVLIFGVLMAGLLSMAVYFLQRERGWIDQLSHSHQGLEQEVFERTRIETQLLHSQEELRNLSHRLQSIREEEKTKIAREVHDELGQVLTVLKMDLSCLNDEVSKETLVFQEKIQSMGDKIDQIVKTIQRICLELRPKILDVFGLAEAIEWHTTEFQARTGIQVQLEMNSGLGMVDLERATTCFRVLQEALTNVARHADATQVKIQVGKINGNCHLDVHDNGKGITEREMTNPHSLGLIGIRERVLHLGGEFQIKGSPGNGTRLSIKFPHSKLSED